jgi:hypothetical protein
MKWNFVSHTAHDAFIMVFVYLFIMVARRYEGRREEMRREELYQIGV